MSADQSDDLLDLALAEIGRRPDLTDRRDQRIGDRKIDRACQTDDFLKPRLRVANDMRIRLRLGITAAQSQVRTDDDHPPCGFVRCRPRTVGIPMKISGVQSDHSHVWVSSPPSKS